MAHDTLDAAQATAAPIPRLPSGDAFRHAIETTLAEFLRVERAALESADTALRDFATIAEEAVVAGGKRLRPTFAHWGWRGAVGPTDPVDPVLPAFAALELLHAFALVHDDVMDGSATRRGRPTAHEALAAQHARAGRLGPAARFGTAGAVLVGDLCLVWADRLLSAATVPDAALLAARRSYDQMRVETIAGQYLDVLGEAEPATWSIDRALRVARLKTASYTVTRPMLFGAALGGAEGAGLVDAYTRYGTAVGEAFQLCDDLLGVYGDPAVTGKPAGDDLRTGKPTVLLLLARRLATPVQRDALDRAALHPAHGDRGRPALTTQEVTRLAGVVAETGAVAAVESMIDSRIALAVEALAPAPIDAVTRSALHALAVTAAHRRF